jgi:hypothetical protein
MFREAILHLLGVKQHGAEGIEHGVKDKYCEACRKAGKAKDCKTCSKDIKIINSARA